MTLDLEDIAAIAKALAAELRQIDINRETERYLCSLPLAERKRRAREEMKQEDRELRERERVAKELKHAA